MRSIYQHWKCRACDAHGKVPLNSTDKAFDFVQKVHDDHEAKSPHCPATVSQLKVVLTVEKLTSAGSGDNEDTKQGSIPA